MDSTATLTITDDDMDTKFKYRMMTLLDGNENAATLIYIYSIYCLSAKDITVTMRHQMVADMDGDVTTRKISGTLIQWLA